MGLHSKHKAQLKVGIQEGEERKSEKAECRSQNAEVKSGILNAEVRSR
jgi:hypothetical protein